MDNLARVAEERKVSTRDAGLNGTRSERMAATEDGEIMTGRITGYVNDSVPNTAGFRSGLSGVAVQAYSLDGELCSPEICSAAASNSIGYFDVVAPVGPDYLVFTANFFLSNTTYTQVANNDTNFTGTTYLVPEARITGYVMTDTPTPIPVAGVVVTTASLNNTQIGTPLGTTTINGSFVAAVPPVPSMVQFTSPTPAYQGNFTWVNATPGEVVNLGTVYLETYDNFVAHVYDAVTRSPIEGQIGSLQVCNGQSGLCATQGNASFTNVLKAFGPPGNDYVIIEVNGYIEFTQSMGFYGVENVGQVIDLGSFYLTPPGTVSLTVNLDYNSTDPSVGQNVSDLVQEFGTGLWRATICSANGYRVSTVVMGTIGNSQTTFNTTTSGCISGGCVGVGSTATIAALPMQNYILITPDYTPFCSIVPTWPIPGLLPVYPTSAWANVTPYETTSVSASLPIGTYIDGQVYLAGTTEAPPTGFVVTAASDDFIPSPGVAYAYVSGLSPFDCPNVVSTPTAFCVPAPPGPVTIQASGPQSISNTTWASTSTICCNRSQFPISLSDANNEHLQSINLTGSVYLAGAVVVAGGSEPIPFASLDVCPLNGVDCFSNVSRSDGSFDVPGPPNWDYITASAAGYASNTVWANVSSAGVTWVGNISMTPLGTLTGLVLDPEGGAILDAHASICAISSQQVCTTPLGSGRVSTGGQYLGLVTGGWLPGSTYRVVVSASGYSTDWAWANVTANETTVVPPIILDPTGVNSSLPSGSGAIIGRDPRSSATGANSAGGVWLTGRVIDGSTGWGLAIASNEFSLTAPGSGSGTGFSSGANTGGFFNQSIPSGLWYLNISAPGYYPFSVFFNATDASWLNLGGLALVPQPWLSGNVTLVPWSLVTTPLGSFTLAPAASITVCTTTGSFTCSLQPTGATNVNGTGYYRVQAPARGVLNISANGLGGGPYSGNGGFVPGYQEAGVNSTNATVPTITMEAFSVYSGHVYDLTAGNGAGVRYASVTVQVGGPGTTGGTAFGAASAQGDYTMFAAPYSGDPDNDGSSQIQVLAIAPNAYVNGAASYDTASAWDPGQSFTLPPIYLEHFGYIEFRVTSAQGSPVPAPGVFSSVLDPQTSGYLSATGFGNQAGWVNSTAPPGDHVQFTATAASDGPYNQTTFYANIAPSRTTYAQGGSAAALGAVSLNAPGYVSSAQVNSSRPPVEYTVVDAAKRLPLSNVAVSVANSGGTAVSLNPQPSNWQGQFFADAPTGSSDVITLSHSAYQPATVSVAVLPNGISTIGTVNLTGDGVVAGRVLAYPSGAPISGATVAACSPGMTICPTAATNASGGFWVMARPGTVYVNISAADFNSNGTVLRVCSDCWEALSGPVWLDAFATVSGVVLGLPSGFPLSGAQVSACVGPTACISPVLTNDLGYFIDSVPPGPWTLHVNATGYSSTTLGVSLGPGEALYVGTIDLNQYGVIEGTVLNEATGSPLAGASVSICGTAAGSSCSASVQSRANGAFTVAGLPGVSQLVVAASGFATAFETLTVSSGGVLILPNPVELLPLGQDVSFPVTGTVVTSGSAFEAGGLGLSGAIVALLSNGTPAYSAQTGPRGEFQVSASTGNYVLAVYLPGYSTFLAPVAVAGPTSVGTIALGVQVYDVSGIVEDGYTGRPIANVTIDLGSTNGSSTTLATSQPDGTFLLELPNGTWSIEAVPGTGGSVPYAPVSFVLTVSGAAVSVPLELLPPLTTIFGLVADDSSGLPIVGATVAITGTAVDGHALSMQATSEAGGAFRAVLPAGNYTVVASAPGYISVREQLAISGASSPLLLAMGGVAALGAGTSGVLPTVALELLGVAAVVLVGVGVLISVRRGGKSGPREPELPSEVPLILEEEP
jgi:hypothetical protein